MLIALGDGYMTLRKKTLVIIGAIFLVLLTFMYFTGQRVIVNSYRRLERKKVEIDVGRVLNTLEGKLAYLESITTDWAFWDDTYQFVQDGNKDYIKSNLANATFGDIGINVIIYVNSANQVVYSKGFDLINEKEIPVSSALLKHVTQGDFSKFQNLDDKKTGIIILPEGPMLISACPVVTSEKTGPIKGMLIMGNYFDAEEINQLAQKVHVKLSIEKYEELEIPEIKNNPNSREVLIKPISEEIIRGYLLLQDIYGQPALFLKIDMFRDIYQEGQKSLHYFFWSLIIIGLIFAVIFLIILERLVLAKLAHLSTNINNISKTGDFAKRMNIEGNDELASLAADINEMLEVLEQSQVSLRLSEKRYRQLAGRLFTTNKQLQDIIEFLPDPTFVINEDQKVIAWNRAIEELTGVAKENILNKGNYIYALPFYGEAKPMLINHVMKSEIEFDPSLYENIEKEGDILFAEVYISQLNNEKGKFLWAKASPLYDSEGNIVGAIEAIRDITDRKNNEKHLEYLSIHDALTGVYNRAFFEQEVKDLENEKQYSVGIISCDLDGLKIVNDTLGHFAGDALLIAAAQLISKCIRKDDLLARIGGDEFAIFLLDIDEKSIQRIIRQIKEEIKKHNTAKPQLPLKISLGYALKGKGEEVKIQDVFKQADNMMYQEKALNGENNRQAIIQALKFSKSKDNSSNE